MNSLLQRRRRSLGDEAEKVKSIPFPKTKDRMPTTPSRKKAATTSNCQDSVSTGDSSCEAREPPSAFFGRYNITISNEVHVKKKSEKKKQEPIIVKQKPPKEKRNVSFHRYDEIIYDNGFEYVYSLHDREVEEESNRDLVDNLEEVMGDVGYFFRCLGTSIHDEALKKINPNKYGEFAEGRHMHRGTLQEDDEYGSFDDQGASFEDDRPSFEEQDDCYDEHDSASYDDDGASLEDDRSME